MRSSLTISWAYVSLGLLSSSWAQCPSFPYGYPEHDDGQTTIMCSIPEETQSQTSVLVSSSSQQPSQQSTVSSSTSFVVTSSTSSQQQVTAFPSPTMTQQSLVLSTASSILPSFISTQQQSTPASTALFVPLPSTDCQAYPSDLILSLSLSIASYQQIISTITSLQPKTTVNSITATSSATVNSAVVTPRRVGPVTVASKRSVPYFSEDVTTISFSLQASSADRNLHSESEPTNNATTSTASFRSSITLSSSFIPVSTITPPQQSGANMAPRPPMAFLLVCALLALTFANFASASAAIPSGATLSGAPLCTGDGCIISALVSVISGTSPGLQALAPSTHGTFDILPVTASTTSLSDLVSPLSMMSTETPIPTITRSASSTITRMASPSVTNIVHTPVMSPCSDNHSFLCVGTITEGPFASPPTPPSFSAAVLLTAAQSPSAVDSTSPTPSTKTESPTLGPSSSAMAVTNIEPPSTSTIYSTTHAPDSIVHSTTIISGTTVAPSLQTSGASGRPTTRFSLLWIILAYCKSTWATWTTKSLPAIETFCTEDPKHGCYEGTPMTVIWQAEQSSKDAQKHAAASTSIESTSLSRTST